MKFPRSISHGASGAGRRALSSIAAVLLAASAAEARQTVAPAAPQTRAGSRPVATDPFADVVRLDLVGRPLASAPWFEHTRACIEGQPLSITVDPATHPSILGASGTLVIVAHKTLAQWLLDRTLVEVRSSSQAVVFPGPDVVANTQSVLHGPIPGAAGTGLGVAYDAVLDLNDNGLLDPGDWIDGLGEAGSEAGFYSVFPTQIAGPLAVSQVVYSGGTWLGQELYYPTDIANLGELPLVVVSHGNGHNYLWYSHIGLHLASFGWIVMSHQNNTSPGIESASTTTLTNTDYLLANLATIAGGALQGHVDSHRITWIGHSRGGEGVVRAYDRLVDGTYTATHFAAADIVLISSIAPTDFLGPGVSDPHAVPYHLWVGGADSDVSGCASCPQCQSFRLLNRARGTRHSISLHGVGHGAFHNGGGSLVATGPCQVSRADTHVLMKSVLLPLLAHHVRGNVPGEDFLWRQWETFHSTGVPEGPCIVVDMTSTRSGPDKLAIDDFESQSPPQVSSSGGAVLFDVEGLVEGRLDDVNSDFTTNADAMNGMTQAESNDASAGVVFGWSAADRFLEFEIPPLQRDLREWRALSFRACQSTRHPATTTVLGDLSFRVGVRDANGNTVTLPISAWGGGIEEPYQRTGCGLGTGWANEFETIRVPLADLVRMLPALDLSDVAAIRFQFGPSHGAAQGRIGLDDVEFVR